MHTEVAKLKLLVQRLSFKILQKNWVVGQKMFPQTEKQRFDKMKKIK